jgi:predicted amidohydrolase
MPRFLTIGAAQLGPIQRAETRRQAVDRLIDLLRRGAAMGCDLVVFPEAALTAFFPHWWIEDQSELDAWFET